MAGDNMSRKSIASIMTFMIVGYTCILPVENARILAIQSIAAKSHWNFMNAILRALADNGHNVTAFTPIVYGNRENYTEIDISSVFPMKVNMGFEERLNSFENHFNSLSSSMRYFRSNCDLIYKNEQLNHVLANNLHANFDAIIIAPGQLTDCMTNMVARSNLPLIFSLSMPSNSFSERETTGHFQNPATLSTMYFDYAFPKTFAQRFTNTIIFLYGKTIIPLEEYFLEMFDPKSYGISTPIPPSLVFINNHFISEAPQPTVPNVISVGGIHLQPPKKIPNDILKFIENSPHGVILFTFGSTIAMSSIPKNIQNIFKEVLAQLPQRILLKYEGEMEDKPANVMTKKWLPQRDILMHQNVKLFISHGGISGIYEAVDAGVPVLGFPLIGDQARNIDGLVEAGMAISMEVLSVSKDSFLKNIVDLINNKKYKRNAKITSEIFKDRPMSPEKSVVYWTEYVIRHKGAPHLKSHALNLTWYQYLLLDVIAVFFICLFIIYRIIKMIYNYIIRYLSIAKIKSE